MSDGPSLTPAVPNCSWCGLAMPPAAHFCPNCQSPNRANGYVLFGLNFIAKNLAIPMAVVVLSFMLTARHENSEHAIASQQQETERAIAEHEKLIDAYGEFADAHSEYRIAENTIAYMAINDGSEIHFRLLTQAILQLDRAFDSIGAKLTPFEEYEKKEPGYKSPFASGRTPLEETWQECFVQPYFSTDPKIAQNYQQEMAAQLQQCKGETCPVQVARAVKHVVDEIDSGRCTNAFPSGTAHTFDWFWTELARVMAQRPTTAASASPNTTGPH